MHALDALKRRVTRPIETLRIKRIQATAKRAGHAIGVDVSNNQGRIDANAIRRAGYSFLIHKVSDGVGWADALAAENLSRARAAGLAVGGYAFVEPRSNRTGADEARYFVERLRTLGFKPGDLRPTLDVETGNGLGNGAIMTYVTQMAAEVQRLLGVRPLIYTFPSFAQWPRRGSLVGAPLWIAHYGVSKPTLPAPWTSYVMWQHSSQARVPGVSGFCDINVAPDLALAMWPEATPAGPSKPPANPCAAPHNVLLRHGSLGPQVETVQKWINDLRRRFPTHYGRLTVDGVFGVATEHAVKRYQRRHHLAVDGVVGPKTWQALCMDAAQARKAK